MKYFPSAYYTLFEPQRELLESQSSLDLPNVRRVYVGVGPESGRRQFTDHERADSYSFAWSAEEAASAGKQQVELDIVSLDDYLGELEGTPPPDIVKIDAEGWDLEVIRGADVTAATCEVFLLEAGVMNKRFRNTAHKVIDAMAARGFILFDITDLNRTARDGALWNVELAFVKRGGALDRSVDSYG